ncbi:MAG: phosphatase PAP2 family protein [Muribaculaceae bacterium]|nr:phosphatase PAP2 family protein [Muribaculaceae bacterium]
MDHFWRYILCVLLCTSIQLTALADESRFERSHSQKIVGYTTDVLLVGMPLAALTGVLIEHDWQGLVQGSYTAALTGGVTLLLKYTVKEERPDYSNFHSFPSGHAATTFATAAFIQRRYGWKLGVPAYVLATYTGWGRVFAKKHHWWDVVAGAAIGTGSAYLFTRPWAAEHKVSITPMSITDPVTETPFFGLSASFTL